MRKLNYINIKCGAVLSNFISYILSKYLKLSQIYKHDNISFLMA